MITSVRRLHFSAQGPLGFRDTSEPSRMPMSRMTRNRKPGRTLNSLRADFGHQHVWTFAALTASYQASCGSFPLVFSNATWYKTWLTYRWQTARGREALDEVGNIQLVCWGEETACNGAAWKMQGSAAGRGMKHVAASQIPRFPLCIDQLVLTPVFSPRRRLSQRTIEKQLSNA